ncbi:hypothetical protein DNTS_008416 [Danionella cerebrum]|nr:hypothetical protein DNTS_008416 [Danionella translucida]
MIPRNQKRACMAPKNKPISARAHSRSSLRHHFAGPGAQCVSMVTASRPSVNSSGTAAAIRLFREIESGTMRSSLMPSQPKMVPGARQRGAREPEREQLLRGAEDALLRSSATSTLRERQIFILKKLVRRCQQGFVSPQLKGAAFLWLLRDLPSLAQILSLCGEKIGNDPEFRGVLVQIVSICRYTPPGSTKPGLSDPQYLDFFFSPLDLSDENLYQRKTRFRGSGTSAGSLGSLCSTVKKTLPHELFVIVLQPAVPEGEGLRRAELQCSSLRCFLLRIPEPQLRFQICSSIAAFYSSEARSQPAQGGSCAVSGQYRGLLVERSGLAETLTFSLDLVEGQPSVKLRLLQTLQILSRASAVNCALMLRARAAQKIGPLVNEEDPELLFRGSEILWNLLESSDGAAVAQQLSDTHCIASLTGAFLHLLLKGFRQYDRQMRNDILVLLSLVSCTAPGPRLIESGFVRQLAPVLTFPELKSHHPLVRTLTLSFSQEDFEMKKLLLNLVLPLSRDLASLQEFRSCRLLLGLLLLLQPQAPELPTSGGRHWSEFQQEQLQLQALHTLETLAPLMFEEFSQYQGSTILLLLLEASLHDGKNLTLTPTQRGPPDAQRDPPRSLQGVMRLGKNPSSRQSLSVGRGQGLHGSGDNGMHGHRKALVSGCVRVLRAVVMLECESIRQDLCDQGAVRQLLSVLRQFTSEQDDQVSLEIQADVLLVLSVLCEGDLHRKQSRSVFGSEEKPHSVCACVQELFGSEGVEPLLHYLKLDPALIFSGLGHNKLLLSALDCIWSCIAGCFATEDAFVAGGGVDLLLRLLQRSPRVLWSACVSVLLELCENPQASSRILLWSEGGVGVPQVLLHIWRKEEQWWNTHSDSSSISEVSDTLRSNIFCIFSKLGFEHLSALGSEDQITLCSVRRYLDFKVGEVLRDHFPSSSSSDDEDAALRTLRSLGEETSRNVQAHQQNITAHKQDQEHREETHFYSEISFTHQQRKMAAEAWRRFVSRTSNYSVLKELKVTQSDPEPEEHPETPLQL